MTGSDGDSRTWLLDANVWLALSVESHIHHPIARQWVLDVPGRLAFCRVTEMALLRHLSNRTIMRDAVLSATDAWAGYDRLRAFPRVTWLDEPRGLAKAWRTHTEASPTTRNGWTDAYLAALAIGQGAALLTFDRDFNRFAGLDATILG